MTPTVKPPGTVLGWARKVLAGCGLACLAAVGTPGAAQVAPALATDLSDVPFETLLSTEVISASRLATQVSQSHTAVSVVTADDIRSHGYRTLADVINSMRGLFTSDDRRYHYLSGRGFGVGGDFTSRVMLLLDGMVVQDNIYNQAYLGNDSIVDLELVERVEYTPGPGSVTHGNNALLGVIHVYTKKGADVGSTQLTTEWFERGGHKQRVTHGQRLENGGSLLLSASKLVAPGEAALYFPYYDSLGLSGGVARNLDAESANRFMVSMQVEGLSLQANWSQRSKLVPYPRADDRFNLFRQLDDTAGYVGASYNADWGGRLKSSTQVYAGSYDDRATFEYLDRDPAQKYRQSRIEGMWWGARQQWVSTAWQGHTVVWGGELRHDHRQRYRWVYLDTDSNATTAAPAQYDFQNRMASLFLDDAYALTDQLTLSTGVRYDRPTWLDCSVSPCKDYGFRPVWSPRFGLSYALSPQTTVKLSRSSAFRMPNTDELPGDGGDTDFRVERLSLVEALVQHQVSPGMRWLASAYRYRLRNLYGWNDASGDGFFDGQTQMKGAEFQVDVQSPGDLRMRASLAWQHASDQFGARVVNAPQWLAKWQASMPIAEGALRLGADFQWVGSRFTSPLRDADRAAAAAPRTLGGYGIWNLTVSSQRRWQGWSVSGGVKNVFNRRYESAMGRASVSQSPGGVVFDAFPVGARSVWLQLSYDHWN